MAVSRKRSLAYRVAVCRRRGSSDDHSWPRRDDRSLRRVPGGRATWRDSRRARCVCPSLPNRSVGSSLLPQVGPKPIGESLRPGSYCCRRRRNCGSGLHPCATVFGECADLTDWTSSPGHSDACQKGSGASGNPCGRGCWNCSARNELMIAVP